MVQLNDGQILRSIALLAGGFSGGFVWLLVRMLLNIDRNWIVKYPVTAFIGILGSFGWLMAFLLGLLIPDWQFKDFLVERWAQGFGAGLILAAFWIEIRFSNRSLPLGITALAICYVPFVTGIFGLLYFAQ